MGEGLGPVGVHEDVPTGILVFHSAGAAADEEHGGFFEAGVVQGIERPRTKDSATSEDGGGETGFGGVDVTGGAGQHFEEEGFGGVVAIESEGGEFEEEGGAGAELGVGVVGVLDGEGGDLFEEAEAFFDAFGFGEVFGGVAMSDDPDDGFAGEDAGEDLLACRGVEDLGEGGGVQFTRPDGLSPEAGGAELGGGDGRVLGGGDGEIGGAVGAQGAEEV